MHALSALPAGKNYIPHQLGIKARGGGGGCNHILHALAKRLRSPPTGTIAGGQALLSFLPKLAKKG